VEMASSSDLYRNVNIAALPQYCAHDARCVGCGCGDVGESAGGVGSRGQEDRREGKRGDRKGIKISLRHRTYPRSDSVSEDDQEGVSVKTKRPEDLKIFRALILDLLQKSICHREHRENELFSKVSVGSVAK